MRLDDAVGMAWGSMRTHKLRTALTTLGVVIGIGSVVAMVTMGESFESAILDQLGADELRGMVATAEPAGQGPVQPGPQNQPRAAVRVFTARDAATLQGLPGVAAVAPAAEVPHEEVTAADGDRVLLQGILATTVEHPDVHGDLGGGRGFQAGALEAVAGANVTTFRGARLAPGASLAMRLADGRDLQVQVVGVLAPREDAFGARSNFQVFVPLEPFHTFTVASPAHGQEVAAYPRLYLRATTDDGVPGVKEAALGYLNGADSDASRLMPEGYETRIVSNQETAAALSDAVAQFTVFIGGVAVISLLVGAIGIANIMLVAVTERTREIGVMKALGARSRDVRRIFLAEAVLIGLGGGMAGLILGALGGFVVVRALFTRAPRSVEVVFPVAWFALAVAVGVLVGVLAGWLPARRATRVDPIEALNYE